MSEDEMRKEENLEHEALDRLKTLEPIDFDYNVVDGSYVDAMLKARNIILDLYQKQKEKNSKIQKYVRSNEWAKDYEKSSCRTKILRILEE